MMKKRIYRSVAVLSAVVLTLAACSNNGNDDNDGNKVGNINVPSQLADSFFVLVAALTATTPDDTEARDTDSVKATTPEDADTTSLGS
jgi:hypothetical protein